MSARSPAQVEREARITETLAGVEARPGDGNGPSGLTVRQLAMRVSGQPHPSRTTISRVTQSLLVMEQDGIVVRTEYGRVLWWALKEK